MAKKIRIVDFNMIVFDRTKVDVERELEKLVNDGWIIITAGGTGDGRQAFVILQKE